MTTPPTQFRDHSTSKHSSNTDNSVATFASSISNSIIINDDHNSLSEYEKLRARNIERNNKRMVELGLMSEEEARVANQKAWKKNTSDDTQNGSLRSSLLGNVQLNNIQSSGDNGGSKRRGRPSKNKVQSIVEKRLRSSSMSTRSSTSDATTKRKNATNNILVSDKENVRKSARKPARNPYEVEGIWI